MKKYAPYLWAVAIIAILAGIYFWSHPQVKGSLDSILTTEAPWPANTDQLSARLAAIKLPQLTAEGTALHIHQHLDIFVHGKPVAVPSDIGIHETYPQFISSIHVHDTSGIVHVESPTVKDFNLGQFFDIWGVKLNADCLGGYCADATNTLAFYVNGQKYTGDPRALTLASHQEIAVIFGTATETPATIPSSYSFPDGY